jgi:preprotein translocase subunit SecE
MSDAATSRLDPLKWGVVLVLVAAGVVGNSYYGEQSLLYRVLALIVLAAAAGWVASTTERGGAFWQLVKGSRTEIRKVVWPTRQETTQTTLIVVVFLIIMSIILWGIDSLLGWLVSMVIG